MQLTELLQPENTYASNNVLLPKKSELYVEHREFP